MDSDTLKSIVYAVLQEYAGEAANGYVSLTTNPEDTLFTLTAIGTAKGRRFVNTAVVVSIEGDVVIIERDQTDKSVVDALLQAGVARERIVCAYAGEVPPVLT
jgi:hypothetical protein